MVSDYRKHFNQQFTEKAYQAFLRDINPSYNPQIDFRIAETPVFLSSGFKEEVEALFADVAQFIAQPELVERMKPAVPADCFVPNTSEKPELVAIDFAVCQRKDGSFFPQLIELQGIASLYAYQRRLCLAYQNHFDLGDKLTSFYGGHGHESYLKTMKDSLIGNLAPEEVVLVDIEPQKQKTKIDFYYTEKDFGIATVCITEIEKEGKQLFYLRNGKKQHIKRIYNRVIFDELLRRKDLRLNFSMTEELEVDWVAHPNWFFMVSKYSMPFIKSQYVPEATFLSDLDTVPPNLSDYVLKPLFSFAGAGVVFDVTQADVDRAMQHPVAYILQKKIEYAPFIPTPDGNAKAEIRILSIWKDGQLVPLLNLARLSKGKILGVDFNKDRTWVGSSAAFFVED